MKRKEDKTADAIQWAVTWGLATIIAGLLFGIMVEAGDKGLLGPPVPACDTASPCDAPDIPNGAYR